MTAYTEHLIETNVYLLIFAAAYGLLIKSETFFRLNRVVLLAMLLIALALPFSNFESSMPVVPGFGIQLPTIHISTAVHAMAGSETFSIIHLAAWVYSLGVLIFAFRLAYQLYYTALLIRSSKKGFRAATGLFEIASPHAPASFFHYLFWNEQVCTEDAAMVRDHESVHAKEWHSIDLIAVRIAEILCWFNPSIHFLKREIEANHEFRADEVVAQRHNNIYQYSNVLLGQVLGVNHQLLAHHFSKPKLLKTRIMMLNKNQSNKSALLKYLFLLPVLGLSLAFHACSKDESASEQATTNDQTKDWAVEYLDHKSPSEGVKVTSTDHYRVVEIMPEFQGGMSALMSYLGENIVYPSSAKAENKEGMVFLEFIVDKSGAIRDVKQVDGQKADPKGPDARLVQSAIAAVNKMPDWIPGKQGGEDVNVLFNLPVQFKLK
jgi:TonB family protein